MKLTNTGMQLTVYLRKSKSVDAENSEATFS